MTRIVAFFFRRLVVEGTSMVPTYLPGELVTAVRRWRRVRPGDVVVVPDPREPQRWLLKRCVARTGQWLEIRGDNENPAATTDSRDFGPVLERDVKWLVLGPTRAAD